MYRMVPGLYSHAWKQSNSWEEVVQRKAVWDKGPWPQPTTQVSAPAGEGARGGQPRQAPAPAGAAAQGGASPGEPGQTRPKGVVRESQHFSSHLHIKEEVAVPCLG